jgi:hypothetical protein
MNFTFYFFGYGTTLEEQQKEIIMNIAVRFSSVAY